MVLQVWLLIFNMMSFMLGLFSACASGILAAPVANGDWVNFCEPFEDITRQMECKSITVQCWCCPVLYFLLSMHLSKSIICRAEAREKVSEKNSISSYLGRLTFFKSKFLFVWIKNYVSVYCSRESFTGPCVVQPLESRNWICHVLLENCITVVQFWTRFQNISHHG